MQRQRRKRAKPAIGLAWSWPDDRYEGCDARVLS